MFEQVLPRGAKKALAILATRPESRAWYLAGGTALALQLGHRKSRDLDFFTRNIFDPGELFRNVSSHFKKAELTRKAKNTLFCNLNGVKFSLFTYAYPRLMPTTDFLGAKLASLQDIAAMKLVAISERATKRDYVDMFFLSKRFSFEEMFQYYEKKFKVLANNKYVLIRALVSGYQCDEDEMPTMLANTDWRTIKKHLEAQAKPLFKLLVDPKQ